MQLYSLIMCNFNSAVTMLLLEFGVISFSDSVMEKLPSKTTHSVWDTLSIIKSKPVEPP